MRGGVPGVGVGLHDIEFWAPVSTNHIGIAVVVPTFSRNYLSINVLSWHRYEIECGIAATSRMAEINVILNGSSK